MKCNINKIEHLYDMINSIVRCKDKNLVCRHCKCFFRSQNNDTRYTAYKTNKTIKAILGQYKIQTTAEIEYALNRFYNAIDHSYITADGCQGVLGSA